jgi:hypothetical protein
MPLLIFIKFKMQLHYSYHLYQDWYLVYRPETTFTKLVLS